MRVDAERRSGRSVGVHERAKIYNFNDSIDRNVLQPVARGYVNVTPEPVRDGV